MKTVGTRVFPHLIPDDLLTTTGFGRNVPRTPILHVQRDPLLAVAGLLVLAPRELPQIAIRHWPLRVLLLHLVQPGVDGLRRVAIRHLLHLAALRFHHLAGW
eukprot:CAMPEP_0174756982 /NCGR_PEP_ID=MMETSP1094-20130205/107031_1 /TAXON_ID=156173 /ORGANISM="Chrysochromulina brevifilum, Strain UTEX LB 985" /LENGTH=101 /DNA_ID=CAMNT_0015962897 /DNA_START=712 /DNA_END=1014 /DNA_ORIENTATION=+